MRSTLMRELDRPLSDLTLGKLTLPCRLFDHMTVVIAGCKIHFFIDAARILTQSLFNQAHRFDELAPVHCTQKAQAGDAVADRDLA